MSQPDSEIGFLPQCGFGADIDFDTLIKANRFLFRVYTPKERSPFEDDTDPFFVAPRFDEQVARSPVDVPKIRFSEAVIGTYDEVARHLDWTTRATSCYISTSFSFSWSIWEAVRRYHQGVKKDVEIAVIDGTALGGRAATAIRLLQKSSLEERTEQFWKWYRFSEDSQSVLVYGMVPRAAILCSIPLLQILRKMPSYFLNSDIQTIHGNPLDQVAWNYRLRKQNYRQFCRDMSRSFEERPTEVRVRDATAGAVRLALALLRPFFHRTVQEDFDAAIAYLHDLALRISQWPRDSWVVNHPEIRKIVGTMILAIAEELCEKTSSRQQEITRPQSVVDELEENLKSRDLRSPLVRRVLSEEDELHNDDTELEDEDDDPTLVVLDNDPSEHKSDEIKLSPLSPAVFQTPITPPESRRNSLLLAAAASRIPVFTPLHQVEQFELVPDILSSDTTQVSENLVSPPLTPPPRSPLFVQTTIVKDADEPSLQVPSLDQVVAVPDVFNDKDISISFDSDMIQGELPSSPSDGLKEFPTAADNNGGDESELEPDEDHEAYIPPSPLDHWVRVRPHLSSFSSQSSIGSGETLCDSVEFPSKRLSLASTDSYEVIPPFSSFRPFGLSSRTVSFSESSPRLPLSPILDTVDPLGIPLPPSPEITPAYESEFEPLSRTSSSNSSSSIMSPLQGMAGTLVERSPLLMPSPAFPHSPLKFSSSQSSLTSSLASSSPTSSPAPSIQLGLPVEATSVFLPPKHRFGLLSPLPDSEEAEGDDDTDSLRSVTFTDNASYLFTGFLVGAFITLVLFTTRRRELLVLT
ncbi:hypothetical protein CVT26_010994 [Gymnopilus dilepis]|uniref:DUF7587 domain-containing protein n=1 Tax=Gymnopilus dilepis TaxID=231916 RepID=A0A409VYA4_9AGAR|nr:hypothetical protein CVT26_010994 [Gymnopilus dilepis]